MDPVKKWQAEKKRIQAWERAKYDGVAGHLPSWFPDPLEKEFYATQDFLRRKYSAAKIRKYFQARQEFIEFQEDESISYDSIEIKKISGDTVSLHPKKDFEPHLDSLPYYPIEIESHLDP